MELRDYLRVLRAHWAGVLIIALLGIGLAATYTFTQAKVYASTATGFVGVPGSTDPALASVNDQLAKSRAKSYVEFATGDATAQRVIDNLHLQTTTSALVGEISVDQPLDTVNIRITARSSSPESAKTLADAYVRALADQVESIENPTNDPKYTGLRIIPIDAAELPGAPVSPRPPLNLSIGLLLGLLTGFAYAVVRSQFDRRLTSASEIERRFSVPIVGRVPVARRVNSIRTSAVESALPKDSREGWGASEAFRKLRTNLAYMDVDNPPHVIVVTSPQASDGKSTVAANLAAAIAVGGVPVTLVDGDLRRPTVATTMEMVEGAGLTDILIGRADVDALLQTHAVLDSLAVLPAGNIPPNPSELLGSKAMQALLGKLASRGMVIIDAPPLLPVTDAAVLTRHSDGAIVVVSHGKTLDTELEQSLSQLSTVQGRVLGLVFNRVPRRDRESGYYGGGYGYYAEPSPEAKGTKATHSKQQRRIFSRKRT